jgi:hypothetical protein
VLKIVRQERYKGMARLRFVAGGRAIGALSAFLSIEASLNKVCSPFLAGRAGSGAMCSHAKL